MMQCDIAVLVLLLPLGELFFWVYVDFCLYMDVGKYLLAKWKEIAGNSDAPLNPIYSE